MFNDVTLMKFNAKCRDELREYVSPRHGATLTMDPAAAVEILRACRVGQGEIYRTLPTACKDRLDSQATRYGMKQGRSFYDLVCYFAGKAV